MNKQNDIKTVGALKNALSQYPDDMKLVDYYKGILEEAFFELEKCEKDNKNFLF